VEKKEDRLPDYKKQDERRVLCTPKMLYVFVAQKEASHWTRRSKFVRSRAGEIV